MTTADPPMLSQYRKIKARFPDALILFRLGDFYELFGEDAAIAARELDLVLTTRSFAKEVRLPMCGVPHHTVTAYVARLIERGYKVALVEQLEDARRAHRLVQRDVVRVITPGTIVEDVLLHERVNNYLVALVRREAPTPAYGLAALDLSTGEFATTQIAGAVEADAIAPSLLHEELSRLTPAEIVLPASQAADAAWAAWLRGLGPARLSPLPDERCTPAAARQVLLSHFGVTTLQAYGCDDLPLAQAAAGALISYLRESQLGDAPVTGTLSGGSGLAHITELRTYHPGEFMTLDAITRRNLELITNLSDGSTRGTLFSVLDHTLTAMGARLLRRWIVQPLLDRARIEERLEAVAALVGDALLRHDLRAGLEGLHDVERLAGRIGFGSANARDLIALRRASERLPALRRHLARATAPRLQALHEQLDELQDVATLIGQAIIERPPVLVREGGLIRRGFDAELDALYAHAAANEAWLAKLETVERERTGIKTLRVRYNEVFGFFIEVPRSKADQVPADYERKATITHAERFVTPDLKAREAEILITRDRIKEREYDLFLQVRSTVAAHVARLTNTARILAELDVLAALAEAAARHNYVKPTLSDERRLTIVGGRHPVVEQHLATNERFVPNDLTLDEDARVIVLTGPNLSGKSVFARQAALIVLMAQIGSFVPATSAHIGLVDRIFVRAGASDDIARGRSTFLVEMAETASILRHATERSLIILDEVGRGTSTYDGMSIAWAVTEAIHDTIGARCLFATHYHELTALADRLAGARNYTMAVKEQGDEVIFLRQVIPGGAARSFGIHVARLAGLPAPVVARAAEVLASLEEKAQPAAAASAPPDERSLLYQPVAAHAAIRERAETGYVPASPDPLVAWPLDDTPIDRILANIPPRELIAALRALYQADVANLTPVQALVLLNELQQRVRGGAG